MKLYPQLNFGGNCEEAFLFYEKNLEGKITAMMKQGQLPSQYNVPPGMEKAVVHARMNVAGVELIGNDVPPSHFQPVRSAYLYLSSTQPRVRTRPGPHLWMAARPPCPLLKPFSRRVSGSSAISSGYCGRSFTPRRCNWFAIPAGTSCMLRAMTCRFVGEPRLCSRSSACT